MVYACARVCVYVYAHVYKVIASFPVLSLFYLFPGEMRLTVKPRFFTPRLLVFFF